MNKEIKKEKCLCKSLRAEVQSNLYEKAINLKDNAWGLLSFPHYITGYFLCPRHGKKEVVSAYDKLPMYQSVREKIILDGVAGKYGGKIKTIGKKQTQEAFKKALDKLTQ